MSFHRICCLTPINTANATWLSGDDVEPRLCDCPKFVPWHRGPGEYNLTTTNLLLPSHFEGVWGIPPAAGGKQELSNSHYKPLGLSPKKASGFPWSLEAWLGFISVIHFCVLESQFSLNFNTKRGRTSVKGALNLRFIASRVIASRALSSISRPSPTGKR